MVLMEWKYTKADVWTKVHREKKRIVRILLGWAQFEWNELNQGLRLADDRVWLFGGGLWRAGCGRVDWGVVGRDIA